MINPESAKTIQQLFAGGNGLLAMDESNPTCDRRSGNKPKAVYRSWTCL